MVLAVATAVLASCGGGGGTGGGGGGGGSTITGNFFPLDSGGRWFFAAAGASSKVRVVGPGSAGGVSGTLVETIDETSGSIIDQSVYVVAADGVRQYTPGVNDPISQALHGLQILRYPLQAGDSYVLIDTTLDLGEDFDGDGRNERLSVRVVNTVIGLETVSTAAGSFSGALHQRQVIDESVKPTGGSATVSAKVTIDSWYAPDVGLVQTQVAISGQGISDSVSEGLTAYGVGNRRSESVAPSLQAVTPTAPAVLPANATVTALFSEPMDLPALATAFTVRDGTGAAVPGSVTQLGSTATFTPATFIWRGGTYTASVSGAEDRVGNAIGAPRSWTFVVDDAAPGVVSTVPAMGAVDVAPGSSMVIDFSEAIDPATASAANVNLTDDFAIVKPVSVTLVGTRLTITPSSPLSTGRSYRLAVSGITDSLGNPMSQVVILFKTPQGRFTFPTQLLSGVHGYAMAIGDVNNDGIADLLMSTLPSDNPPYQLGLVLFAGRADGSLAAPVLVNVGAQFGSCPAEAIAVGDVNGDGLPDVVLGSYTCGIQVLRQSSAGTLDLAEHLPTPHASRLRFADLDGDGKPDLVGTGGGSSVGIWKRGPGGALVEAGTFSLGPYSGVDFDVGDLNGDGRPDLAVALVGSPGADIAILHQQVDGSFALSFALATGNPYGSPRVAMGDLDGDGRADIVSVSTDRVTVFYQGAGGSLLANNVATLINASAVSVADMDNDGRADIVVSHLSETRVGVYYQQAGGTLSGEELYLTPPQVVSALQPMALGDVNGDGRRDIFIAGSLLGQHPNGGLAALGSVERGLPAVGRVHPGLLSRYGLSASRAAQPTISSGTR